MLTGTVREGSSREVLCLLPSRAPNAHEQRAATKGWEGSLAWGKAWLGRVRDSEQRSPPKEAVRALPHALCLDCQGVSARISQTSSDPREAADVYLPGIRSSTDNNREGKTHPAQDYHHVRTIHETDVNPRSGGGNLPTQQVPATPNVAQGLRGTPRGYRRARVRAPCVGTNKIQILLRGICRDQCNLRILS